jgi:hypothetical protein
MLSAKLDATKLPVAKARPESLLGVGLIATQLARFDPNAFHNSAPAQAHSLTLALSLSEGEGINTDMQILSAEKFISRFTLTPVCPFRFLDYQHRHLPRPSRERERVRGRPADLILAE